MEKLTQKVMDLYKAQAAGPAPADITADLAQVLLEIEAKHDAVTAQLESAKTSCELLAIKKPLPVLSRMLNMFGYSVGGAMFGSSLSTGHIGTSTIVAVLLVIFAVLDFMPEISEALGFEKKEENGPED